MYIHVICTYLCIGIYMYVNCYDRFNLDGSVLAESASHHVGAVGVGILAGGGRGSSGGGSGSCCGRGC